MHVVQSGTACDRVEVKAGAVIGDLEGELATARADRDMRGGGGVGVLVGVLQRLEPLMRRALTRGRGWRQG